MSIKPLIIIFILLLIQTISTCYTHDNYYMEIKTTYLPTYYINNFRFLLFTEIRRGYTSEDSTFIEDSTLIEPQYIRDSKDIFFEYLYNYLGSNPYKDYNVFDMYGYISTTEPQNPWAVMNDVEDFLSETNYYEALILYGHGARVLNTDYFIYLRCLDNTLSSGEGISVPDAWANYVCQNNYIYYLRSRRIRNIFESRPLSGLPSLVYFIACNSGRYDNEGSWRWAFRLSTNDPYNDWNGRAFIGLYTTVLGDARAAIWDDLLYYIIDSLMYGEEENLWSAFSNYIEHVATEETWDIDVGYRATVQDFAPGEGYVREQYEFNPDADTVYVYAGDSDVFIDPSYEEHVINCARYSLEKYLGPLYNTISKYIIGVKVTKGFSDDLYDRYSVKFELDSNVFRRGRHVEVIIYVYKKEDIIFPVSISVSLDLGNIGYVDEFINYLTNEMQSIKELLEQKGLTVDTEVLFSHNVLEYHYYWENIRYRVYYNDIEISGLVYRNSPLLGYHIHYDMYSKRSINVDIYTDYELVLYLLNKGYEFPQFNISKDYLVKVLEDYGVNASIDDFKELYEVCSKGFRPIYYLSYETCITYTYPGSLPLVKEMCTNNRIVVDGITGKVLSSPNMWVDPHAYLGGGAYATNYNDTIITNPSINETNDLFTTQSIHENNSEATLNGSVVSNQYTTSKYNRYTNTYIIVYIIILIIMAVLIVTRLKFRKT